MLKIDPVKKGDLQAQTKRRRKGSNLNVFATTSRGAYAH